MKHFIQLTKGDSIDNVPQAALDDVLQTLVDDFFDSQAAKSAFTNISEKAKRPLAAELLDKFFEKRPNGGVFVEIPQEPISVNAEPVDDGPVADHHIRISSSSDPSKSYLVGMDGTTAISCECLGFQHRGQCRHLVEAERLMRGSRA